MKRKLAAIAFALCCLATASLSAQVLHPEDSLRVTLKDTLSQRIHGRLIGVSSDSLTVLVTEGPLALSRSTIRRVERFQRWNVGLSVGVGCAAMGALLGGMGLGTHDPDSPGIERTLGTLGFVVGCGLGALGGVIAARGGGRWEDVTL